MKLNPNWIALQVIGVWVCVAVLVPSISLVAFFMAVVTFLTLFLNK